MFKVNSQKTKQNDPNTYSTYYFKLTFQADRVQGSRCFFTILKQTDAAGCFQPIHSFVCKSGEPKTFGFTGELQKLMLELKENGTLKINQLPKKANFIFSTPKAISLEGEKIFVSGDLYFKCSFLNTQKSDIHAKNFRVHAYPGTGILDNEQGKINVENVLLIEGTYGNNENGSMKAGVQCRLNFKAGFNNTNGKAMAKKRLDVLVEGPIHNRGGQMVGTDLDSVVVVKSQTMIRQGLFGWISGRAKTHIITPKYTGELGSRLSPCYVRDKATASAKTQAIFLAVDKLHLEGSLMNPQLEITSKQVLDKETASALFRADKQAEFLHKSHPAYEKEVEVVDIERVYGYENLVVSLPGQHFIFEEKEKKRYLFSQQVKFLADSLEIKKTIGAIGHVSLETFKKGTSNTIIVAADILTQQGNIRFKGERLLQMPTSVIGSHQADSEINFQVKKLHLQGKLGPNGKFKTSLLQEWQFDPHVFQSKVDFDIKLLLNQNYDFIHPIDVQNFNVEMHSSQPPGLFKIRFLEEVLSDQNVTIHAKGFKVYLGNEKKIALKQVRAQKGFLKIEGYGLEAPFTAFVGAEELLLKSQTDVVMGTEKAPNNIGYLRTEGNCRIEVGGVLKTYHVNIDVNHDFFVTAPKEWDDVANQIYVKGKSTLRTPLSTHRILTETKTTPISNAIGNAHWSEGIITHISAVSVPPLFITMNLETTDDTKICGGQWYYGQQWKGKAPIAENFVETHLHTGKHLSGDKNKGKAYERFGYQDYSQLLPHHGKSHLASCGMGQANYQQKTIALPGQYRAGTVTLSQFMHCLMGTLENIRLGQFRPFEPLIDVLAYARPDSALKEAPLDASTIFVDILELSPKCPALPRVVIRPEGFTLHSTAKALYPWRKENKIVATALLSNIGQFPPEFPTEKIDIEALQYWLMNNTLEWIQQNQLNTNPQALMPLILKPQLSELKKPILLYQEQDYQRLDGVFVKILKLTLVVPEHYKRLWLQPGGSLMAEVLNILGAKGACLHITHPVEGRKSVTATVDTILVETRPYTYQAILEQTETHRKWGKKKTHTTHQVVTLQEVQQVASLKTDGKLSVTAKTLVQTGSEIKGGAEETQLNIGYHQANPVIETGVESYQESKKTLWSKKSLEGQILKTKNILPSKLLGEGDIKGVMNEGNYNALHIESKQGNIHLLYTLGVRIYTKVISQTLPPHIAKKGQLLTVGQSTIQYGITSLFRALTGKILLETEGKYESQGTFYQAKDKIEIIGKTIQEAPPILVQSHAAKTAGLMGLQWISQTQTMTQETAIPSRFITEKEGVVHVRSTEGPVILVAPQVETGTFKVSATGGDATILPLNLKQNMVTQTRSTGIKWAGSEVLEAVMQQDFALAARSMLHEISILNAVDGLLKAKDTADRIGEGTKTAYYLYKLYQGLSEGKGFMEALAGDIDTTVKIRFGHEEIEERIEDVQLAWLGARAIILRSTHDVNLKGTQSNAEHLTIRAVQKATLEGAVQSSSQAQVGSGFSIGADAMKLMPYCGIDFNEGEHTAKQYIATRFDNLKTLFIEGNEIHLKNAVQLETEQAFLRASKFIIEEGMDTERSKNHGFNIDTALNIGMQSGYSKANTVGSPTGITASQTFYADIKEQTHLIGGHLLLRQEVMPLIVQDFEAQEQVRYQHAIPPDGECAFTCLGIHRSNVEDLIARSEDITLRALVAPEIRSAFLTRQLPWQRNPHLRTRYDKTNFMALDAQYQHQADIEAILNTYCQDKEVFIDFLELEYLGKQGTPKRWLSYIPETTTTLDALAKLNDLNVIIWKECEGVIQPIHVFVWSETARMCELYHTWDIPVPLGRSYPLNSENHFNLLTSKPGVLYTETLVHQDIVAQSKAKQIGFQMGLTKTGMTDVNIRNERTEQITRSTLSSGIEVVAKQSTSPNREESLYQASTKKKTHIRMVVPHEWAEKGVKALVAPPEKTNSKQAQEEETQKTQPTASIIEKELNFLISPAETSEPHDIRLKQNNHKIPKTTINEFNNAMLLTEQAEDNFVNPKISPESVIGGAQLLNFQFKPVTKFKTRLLEGLDLAEQRCRDMKGIGCDVSLIKAGIDFIPDSTNDVILLATGNKVAREVAGGVHWLYREGKVNRSLKKIEESENFNHVFSKDKRGNPRFGHVEDTSENKRMIAETLAEKNIGKIDQWGEKTYAKVQPDGTESWIKVTKDGIIKSGGVNKEPRYFLHSKGPKK